ncbi:hypothetical protein PHET_04632 [Paragonimus heterotremus]|uniref:Uncharacterized protein n=1 Tax=Paragonimus heterotremus TaxID=100268 RepID=A0A8J4TG90_9TREM|nr:hypothetical protein PHET_04632 [Paragonimus heterotremus]
MKLTFCVLLALYLLATIPLAQLQNSSSANPNSTTTPAPNSTSSSVTSGLAQSGTIILASTMATGWLLTA